MAFSNWLSHVNHYFDWYGMLEGKRARFAKMKLIGQAKLYCTSVERKIGGTGQEPISIQNET